MEPVITGEMSSDKTAIASSPIPTSIPSLTALPLPAALQAWQAAIGELWQIGTQRVLPNVIAIWRETTTQLESVGLLRLAEHANQLTTMLATRPTSPRNIC